MGWCSQRLNWKSSPCAVDSHRALHSVCLHTCMVSNSTTSRIFCEMCDIEQCVMFSCRFHMALSWSCVRCLVRSFVLSVISTSFSLILLFISFGICVRAWVCMCVCVSFFYPIKFIRSNIWIWHQNTSRQMCDLHFAFHSRVLYEEYV